MPEDTAAELAHLQSQMKRREPPGVGAGYLVPVEFGRAMHTGTTTRSLAIGYEKRRSGLLVPVGAVRSPAPIDQMMVYLTAQEVLGFAPPQTYALEELRRVPLADTVRFVAELMAALRSPTASRAAVDQQFVEQWLVGSTKDRVKNLLRDPSRALVAPQVLLVMTKLAIEYSPSTLEPGQHPGNLAAAMLTIAHHLGRLDRDPNELVVTETPGRLGREIIANQLFNFSQDEVSQIAGFVRRWIQMPVERAGKRGIVDLEDAFGAATGVRLRDLMAVGAGLWSAAVNGTPVISRTWFENFAWSRDRLDRTLGLLAADAATLRTLVEEETTEFGLEWAFSTFERFPVVRFDDETLIVLDPVMMLRRVFGPLPLWDIRHALEEQRGDAASKKTAGRITHCVRILGEAYALDVLRNVAPSLTDRRRVYDDSALKAAYAKKGQRIADAAIDYGSAWIVVEVTTSQMTRRSVAGQSDDAIIADLDKLTDEAEQVHDTIAAMRHDETRLTGMPAPVRRQRFLPLLVVADGFPVNPMSLILLREKVAERDLLTAPDIGPLEVVDVSELEMVEGLQEKGGPSLHDLLDGKSRGSLMNMALRDYVLLELGLQPTRPRRLSDLLEQGLQPIFDALGETGEADQAPTL